MSSKFITALIILTVAALGAAAAFQYLEMESFGLPQTLKERFFPEQPAQSVESTPAESTQSDADNTASTTEAAPANQ
jgi:hypothetical protein